MKFLYLPLIYALVFYLAGSTTADAANLGHVVIDPGHGGHDRGANRSYYFEKHLALDVAFRLQKYLKTRGLKTTLTRGRDTFIPLEKRSATANRVSDSVFVSIHFNSARNSGANGIETFYNKSSSRGFANYVHGSIVRNTRSGNRGVKRARFIVLRSSKRPAVLVECGFLTNSKERTRCLDPTYRQRLAEGIGAGIIAYRKAVSSRRR